MPLKFLKYLFWGWCGAFFVLQFSGGWVDFFVLTIAFAFPALGLGPTLMLALALSLFYGGHSVSPWATWWLPAAATLLLLRLWKSYSLWSRWMQHAVGMTLLLAGQWAWGVACGGSISGAIGGFIPTWAGTMVFGLLFLPLFYRVGEFIMQRFPRHPERMGELPLYWQNMKSPRVSRKRRRPFGLEGV